MQYGLIKEKYTKVPISYCAKRANRHSHARWRDEYKNQNQLQILMQHDTLNLALSEKINRHAFTECRRGQVSIKMLFLDEYG